MLEAIATVCLLADPATCREVLIPGFEAPEMAACVASITGLSPKFPEAEFVQGVDCKPLGAIAKFREVAAGVYAHRGGISNVDVTNFGDVSNIGFIVGATSVAVIDTGGARKVGEAVYRAIRQHTDLPISHAILTHMHPDHVLGASVFKDAGARIIGHSKLGVALRDRAETYTTNFGGLMGAKNFIGTAVVVPDDGVTDRMDIDLGGRVVELRGWQTSHTSNDLTAFDVQSGVMFTGDLVFHEHTPALDGSVRGWVAVLEEMAELPIHKIVPGHGGPVLNWPDGAMALSAYLDVLITDTKAALDAGESLNTAAESIANSEAVHWELFELFNARNATVAYTELEWE